ncbi:NAD-dependent protein deacetylase [Salisaeta longa]|uniref:NAD-dependent protein deacetylase n=1 Tax=Salisaeta longa TaxID=503170 RepID=UPI0003B5E52C|nr:NAD-dependent protein deacetylase [Salisaeta longa]
MSDPMDDLVALLRDRRVVVLTGAGVSTESGIPDYRGPTTRRKTRAPVRYRAFMNEEAARRHYWARSALGWPRFAAFQPNAGHDALAALEQAGCVEGVITQNVDRLHQKAGSEAVVELHGALADVRCMDCNAREDRSAFQKRLLLFNPNWEEQTAALAPDGDAELPPDVTAHFRVPACRRCGGILKPDVVFFGESVPAARVQAAWALLERGEVLLVAGSSLAVYSGYRFVLRARDTKRPVALVNLGTTRADAHTTVRVQGKTGTLLPALAHRLLPSYTRPHHAAHPHA